ncbi:protease 4 [Sphingobium jiangsuense]|uniref:Protease-4 n=1 Tax=Sphingobium jiangsuense TaxID=870476 RepID=A0A7W6BRS9_9SPHN|nr:signal peptide peptidase SppA [Sphingobium jiangsuense]MBB3927608.1 protease-4 [Sphingobium jiangsuense]GLS98737.1 protease 4 [Sphingobium jiangsuense]
MAFAKAIWRFIMAVKDVLVLCFLLLFFATLYAMLTFSAGERPAHTSEGALLLDLDGYIVEQPRAADPASLLIGGAAPVREYRLRDIVMALEAARTDPRVKAVVLDLDGFMGGGQVAIARVGKALDGLRAAKKPVLAYATAYEDDGYQLAAHAGEVWLNPLGGVALLGPGGSQLYYKGLIDKLGITTHIFRVGTYKSAVEPFLRTDQSPEARQANQALADHLWQNWKADVAAARPAARIIPYSADPVAAVEAAQGNLARAAIDAKLVDKLGDDGEFERRVAGIAGENGKEDGPAFAAIDLDDYIRAKRPANKGQIGVLTVAGEIVDGEAVPGTAGGDSIADQLYGALADKDLKALVLRVDSPGGSVLASERIRRAIVEARAQGLPVVVSMGNVAASGGYWIATASDRILAEPSTVTGSIGVFGIVPSFEGMLAKIGVTSDGIRTTPLSGEPNVLGGLSPEFRRVTQLGVEDAYRRFLALVAAARKTTPDKVDAIAQGRVWDGGTARQLGLVDGFGGLEEAIAEAARLAKLDPAKARPYHIEPKVDPFTRFIEDWIEKRSVRAAASPVAGRDLVGRQGERQQQMLARALRDAALIGRGASVQASCLSCAPYAPAAAAGKDDRGLAAMLLDLLRR